MTTVSSTESFNLSSSPLQFTALIKQALSLSKKETKPNKMRGQGLGLKSITFKDDIQKISERIIFVNSISLFISLMRAPS